MPWSKDAPLLLAPNLLWSIVGPSIEIGVGCRGQGLRVRGASKGGMWWSVVVCSWFQESFPDVGVAAKGLRALSPDL